MLKTKIGVEKDYPTGAGFPSARGLIPINGDVLLSGYASMSFTASRRVPEF